jgi:hypothetical protein
VSPIFLTFVFASTCSYPILQFSLRCHVGHQASSEKDLDKAQGSTYRANIPRARKSGGGNKRAKHRPTEDFGAVSITCTWPWPDRLGELKISVDFGGEATPLGHPFQKLSLLGIYVRCL